jgi:hypothetical protein
LQGLTNPDINFMTSPNNPIHDSFCPYYDQGLLIESSPQGKSMVAMCCFQQRHAVSKVDFHDDHLEQLREIGKIRVPNKCNKNCSHPGHISNEKELSYHEDWWDFSGKKIKKLHLKQGLICNLTCISCSSKYSSSWNQHYHLFEPDSPRVRLIKNPRKNWQDLDLTNLTQLHFDGGEPLLNDDMPQILKHLDNIGVLGNVTININTNGTVMANDDLLALWAKAKWVRLFFSLDGIESTFEYTRYPAKWLDVEKNIFAYRDIQGPCLLLEVNSIVGIHNLFNMPDFVDWWKNNLPYGNQKDPSKIFLKHIEDGTYGGNVLNLAYLPENLKASAVSVLKSISDCPGSNDLIPLISTAYSNGWLTYFEKLDSIRNTDWKSMLPQTLVSYVKNGDQITHA